MSTLKLKVTDKAAKCCRVDPDSLSNDAKNPDSTTTGETDGPLGGHACSGDFLPSFGGRDTVVAWCWVIAWDCRRFQVLETGPQAWLWLYIFTSHSQDMAELQRSYRSSSGPTCLTGCTCVMVTLTGRLVQMPVPADSRPWPNFHLCIPDLPCLDNSPGSSIV